MFRLQVREVPLPVAATLMVSSMDNPLLMSSTVALKLHRIVAVEGIADFTVML